MLRNMGTKARGTRESPSKTRAQRGKKMRARLLEATITSIAWDGVAGASIERITQRAGVSRGLVRHYYGTKSKLLAEAFQLLADDYRAMLGIGRDDEQQPTESPELRLRDAILPMFERLEGGPTRQYAWFGFWALARSESEIERINHALYEEVVRHLGGLIAAVASRRGRDIDAAAAGRGLAAMMEGAWVHCIIGVEGVSVREAERLCLDYALRLLGLESLDEAMDGAGVA
jgi:TetR/AcrR family transcriptional regulator, transcriptional repressor of bet genes